MSQGIFQIMKKTVGIREIAVMLGFLTQRIQEWENHKKTELG